MPIDVVIPSFGESVTEGTIAQWLKKEGDHVQQDEMIVEVESEKATQPIPSPATGLLHRRAKEGDRVEVGSVIGTIDEAAAPAKPAEAEKAREEKKPAPPPAPEKKEKAEKKPEEPKKQPEKKPAAKKDEKEPAKERAVQKAEAKHPSASAGERRVPMSAIRQRIAERLLASQKSTASLTTFNEVDMSAVMDLRARFKDKFKEQHGVGLGFMSFFVKASIEALKAFPLANASIDGRDVVHHDAFNIGVAVSTEKGLMVPVLRDADKLSFADIEVAIAELAEKARHGKIEVSDLQGGTFTITNGGIFGSMLSTPILNYPQTAILGMHTIQKRPVVRDDQIVIRPMMYLALTYDHRLIDGREAVLFLMRIKECIEEPMRMVVGV